MHSILGVLPFRVVLRRSLRSLARVGRRVTRALANLSKDVALTSSLRCLRQIFPRLGNLDHVLSDQCPRFGQFHWLRKWHRCRARSALQEIHFNGSSLRHEMHFRPHIGFLQNNETRFSICFDIRLDLFLKGFNFCQKIRCL